jgi:excisionase family DNA binding protein
LATARCDPYALARSGANSTPEHRIKPRPIEAMQSEATKDMAALAVNELGPMLTAAEVADMLHLHVNTVKRLGDRGELPFYRVCKRGDRRFRLDDVMRFLSENR